MSERVLKKKKAFDDFNSNLLFSYDAIIEITKFIKEIKDYFNLSLINKSMFELMMKENLHSLNEIFKRNDITLNENFPNYLFHLNNLKIINQKENLQLLQNFTNLNYLKLYNCEFEDKHLQHLNMLKELNLKYCDNILGECFKEFKQLKTLKLDVINNVTDDSLIALNNITTLDITECDNITGKCFQNFPQLKQLIYYGSTTTIIKHINSLQNLKILHLTLNYNPEEKYSLNLENLEELNLGYSEYYYFEDKDLINLPNLRTLWLYGVKDYITGSCFIKLQNLQNLFLYECYLEEGNLQYLTNLKTFDCDVKISAYYLRNLTKLKKLTFIPNNEFKEEYLKDLTLLKLLKFEVDYDDEEKIEINFTGKYLNNLENLTELIIPHSKVEDKYLIELTKLKTLDVSNCKTITGECLLNLNNLQKLNINNTNIHERYLQNLNYLKYLNIDNCNKIIIGKFLLQMNRLNHFYRVRWFNITQINEIKLNIKKEMILMNAIRNLENINFVNKQDKSIDEIQEIYNQLLEKRKRK
ncbi:hypothetical protein ABK040_000731 [Willaertia magna]